MKRLITILLAVISFQSLTAQYHYPPTKTVDSTDTYFGVTYHDPYRWLEHIETPEVETWFKQEANFTDSILNTLNGRDALIKEWNELINLVGAMFSTFSYENGRLFYRKMMPGESVGKIYYRQGIDGKEQLLFDPIAYISGKTLAVQSISPSYDGRKLAIAYAEQGAELSVIKIMDVDSKQFLKDSLYPASFNSWAYDNNSFLYGWIKSADSKDPTSRLNSKTKLHILGTNVNSDKDFFSNASYPELNIDPGNYPDAYLNEDSKNYIFSGESSVQSELKMYYAPISEFNSSKINWKVVAVPSDKIVRGLVIKNDDIVCYYLQ